MKYGILFIVFSLGIGVLFTQCNPPATHLESDRLLARVYNKSLFLSDMDGILPGGMSTEDSSLIINKFVGNWVREAVLLREAEKNIPHELDIDQLVEDYRASLIKHNYENVLVEKLLDSIITVSELEGFYNKNKEQYKLESPIMQCRFIKANKDAPQLKQALDWWKAGQKSDLAALKNWCGSNASVHHLQDSIWYKVQDIGAYMPQEMLTVDNFDAKSKFVQNDEGSVYMFQLLDKVSKTKTAPLVYVEGQIRVVILHKRRSKLLEEMKDKLYDEAMRKNGVSVFQ